MRAFGGGEAPGLRAGGEPSGEWGRWPRAGRSASRLEWLGAGTTGFAGAPAEGGAVERAVRAFLQAGGAAPSVLEDRRFEASGWIGEDAGVGERTGLYSLLDLEEVGTIVTFVDPAADLQAEGLSGEDPTERALSALAREHPHHFFVLCRLRRRDRSRWRLVAPNLATLRGPPEAAGTVAACLESVDRPSRLAAGGRPRAVMLPSGVSSKDLDSALGWRLQEGLHRSLERGTRWVAFEPLLPTLLGGVEREVRAFLLRLERDGVLASEGTAPAFEVRCSRLGRGESARGAARGEAGGHGEVVVGGDGVRLEVRARLRRPGGARTEEMSI